MREVSQFELVECVSRSGMSEVWRAKSADGPVAVKKQRTNAAIPPRRFSLEMEIHASLTHPHIVAVRECSDALVTEWVEGGMTLAARIAQGPLSEPEALSIAGQILSALNYCHQLGILHRDVKPSNILLRDRHAYLIDFGVACYFHQSASPDASGTAEYMSPEQIQNPASADQRSDVYAFGCVLYEMLSGKPPFPATGDNSDAAVKMQHVAAAPNDRIPGVSRHVIAAILRALAKSPADRFPGCGSFALALEAGPSPGKTLWWVWPALALLILAAVVVKEFFL